MNQRSLNDFNVSTGTYNEFLQAITERAGMKASGYVCVANVHMFVEANRDHSFRAIINKASIVTPDGIPLCWYLRLKHGTRQERVAGMDLLPDLLAELERRKMSVYFYGGTASMLEQTSAYIAHQYPTLKVAGSFSPPFRALTSEEEASVVDRLNDAGASIVFVILGCPRQEKWMASMNGKVNALMIGVGGALPVLIGQQKRAPRWMQRSGLEWLYRLLQEPRRLFKRYAITNSLFLFLLCKDMLTGFSYKKSYQA